MHHPYILELENANEAALSLNEQQTLIYIIRSLKSNSCPRENSDVADASKAHRSRSLKAVAHQEGDVMLDQVARLGVVKVRLVQVESGHAWFVSWAVVAAAFQDHATRVAVGEARR